MPAFCERVGESGTIGPPAMNQLERLEYPLLFRNRNKKKSLNIAIISSSNPHIMWLDGAASGLANAG